MACPRKWPANGRTNTAPGPLAHTWASPPTALLFKNSPSPPWCSDLSPCLRGLQGLGSRTAPACPFSLPRAPIPALVMASHSWAHISFSSPVLDPYPGSSSTFLSSRVSPSLFSGSCPERANWVQEHPGLGPFMVFLIYQTEHAWYMVSDFKKLSHLIMISLLH